MSAPTKKRRVELVQVAPAGGEASLQLSSFAPTLSLADGVTVTLSSTPPAKTETVANAESLAAVLKRRAEVARQTHDRWVRSPRAAWIQSLLAELGPPAREELLALQRRHTTLAAEDFATRWELGAEWSGRVVALWLGAEGRSVEEVVAKAAEFGHEKEELSSGVVLEGGLLHSLATGADVGVEELLPWVKALTAAAAGSAGGAATEAPTASLYRVDPSNHFLTAADTSAPLDSLGDEARAAEQRDDLVTRHLLDSMPYLSLSLSLPWRGAAADRERARRRVPEHHLRLCERRERLRRSAA